MLIEQQAQDLYERGWAEDAETAFTAIHNIRCDRILNGNVTYERELIALHDSPYYWDLAELEHDNYELTEGYVK